MATAAVPYLLGGTLGLQIFSQYQQGQAQSRAYEAQAQQAESDARTSLIERKRALIETLAQQNVGAAAQGRTIGSISALQREDVRRAGYDTKLISGGGAAQAGSLRSAGKSARTQSYLNIGSSLLSGASKYSSLGNSNKFYDKQPGFIGPSRAGG